MVTDVSADNEIEPRQKRTKITIAVRVKFK